MWRHRSHLEVPDGCIAGHCVQRDPVRARCALTALVHVSSSLRPCRWCTGTSSFQLPSQWCVSRKLFGDGPIFVFMCCALLPCQIFEFPCAILQDPDTCQPAFQKFYLAVYWVICTYSTVSVAWPPPVFLPGSTHSVGSGVVRLDTATSTRRLIGGAWWSWYSSLSCWCKFPSTSTSCQNSSKKVCLVFLARALQQLGGDSLRRFVSSDSQLDELQCVQPTRRPMHCIP